jgi:hypothetical protein
MYTSPVCPMRRAGSSYANDDTRTWRVKYSLGRCARGASGRPFNFAVKSAPPSSIIKNIGTQIALSSTIPSFNSGIRSNTPLRMRSVAPSAPGTHKNTDSIGATNESSGSVYQPSPNGRRWSATWNTGVTPCSTKACQIASWSGCDSGRPSTSAGAIIASRTPSRSSRASSANSHALSRSVQCATGCTRPPPSVTTVAHQRFHAVMFAVSAERSPSSVRSHNRPKFGNTTHSSTPMSASLVARAAGSQ